MCTFSYFSLALLTFKRSKGSERMVIKQEWEGGEKDSGTMFPMEAVVRH